MYESTSMTNSSRQGQLMANIQIRAHTLVHRVDVLGHRSLASEMMVVTENVRCQLPIVPGICEDNAKISVHHGEKSHRCKPH